MVLLILIGASFYYTLLQINDLGTRLKAADDRVAAVDALIHNFSIVSTKRALCLTYTDDNGPVVTLSCDHADQGWQMGTPNQ